jgi:hypothetical protein
MPVVEQADTKGADRENGAVIMHAGLGHGHRSVGISQGPALQHRLGLVKRRVWERRQVRRSLLPTFP